VSISTQYHRMRLIPRVIEFYPAYHSSKKTYPKKVQFCTDETTCTIEIPGMQAVALLFGSPKAKETS